MATFPPGDMVLPQEICDMVVDYVSSDRVALTSLALAHRSFVHSTRVPLFRTIHLHNIRRCIKFNSLLDSSSRLWPSIHHLSLVVDSPNWPYGHEKVILGILSRLTRLRCIAVTDTKSLGVNFQTLPRPISTALLETFSQRTLKGIMLTVNRISVPGLLGRYPALQDLTLIDIPLEDSENIFLRLPSSSSDGGVAQKQSLHTLRLARTRSVILDRVISDKLLLNKNCSLDLTSLKRLAVSYNGFSDTHVSLNSLLKQTTSLEHLSIQPTESSILFSEFNDTNNMPVVRDPLFLSHCPSLRTLHVFAMYEIRLHVGQPDGPTLRLRPYRWLAHCLNSVDPENNHIETIKISFRFPFWYGRDELSRDGNRQILNALDRAIARAPLSKLERVVVAICAVFDPPEETPFEDTIAHVADAMPLTNGKGLLEVVEADAKTSPIKFL